MSEQDTAFMTTRQLRDENSRREQHANAVQSTMAHIMADEQRMVEILFAEVVNDDDDLILKKLIAMARENDPKPAQSLIEHIRNVVGEIALKQTKPPEPSCDT